MLASPDPLAIKLLSLAKACRQDRDFGRAVEYYQQILALQPQRADIYFELGNTYNQLQDSQLAIAAYQRGIDLKKPELPWVYQGLAKAFYRQGQDSEAISAWQQAIDLDPQTPDWVYKGLGDSLYRQGKLDRAISAYQQAIKLNPQAPHWLYRQLGDIFAEQGKIERALGLYQKLIKVNPVAASLTYMKIGDLFDRQGKFFLAKAAYQQAELARSLSNINEVIAFMRQNFVLENQYFNLDILDNGCDPTGQQLAFLAEQTQGKVVGTNVYQGFPLQTVKVRRPNNEFYQMDGQNLTFADYSFDLVISLNVLEHIPDPVPYLQECFRVMRPGGFGFFSWYPLWSGATGHHVHPDMVSRKAQELGITYPNYTLDGTSIPHWGHLLYSATQMLSLLIEEKHYHPELAKWMTKYIYQSSDLNRWFWRDFWRVFQSIEWKIIKVKPRRDTISDPKTRQELAKLYGMVEDFQVCGAQIVVQK